MNFDKQRFVVQVCLSVVVLVAGFAVLLSESGDRSDAELAAGGTGLIFGFWLNDRRR
jgi:hypothetical protein